MQNAEAQSQYYEELQKVVSDLNTRYVRARLPRLAPEEAETLVARLLADRSAFEGISWEDLLRLPDRRFFRRKGEPAWTLVGTNGEAYADVDAYVKHLAHELPDPYLHSRDMREYVETLRAVVAGTMTVEQAMKKTPTLKRVGGVCPCSKSVRWVVEEPAPAPAERA
jgi:hypothetical protein